MKYMRVVAYGGNSVFVQTSNQRNRDYEQTIMTLNEFEEFVKENFPKEWEEYLEYNKNVDWQFQKALHEFFYRYGETEEMRRKGESFVFER